MSTLIHEKIEQCRAGRNPTTICRVNSGWVVWGDRQVVPGYCLLLADPVMKNINEMDESARKTFLYEMSCIGDALLNLTEAWQINYEMLGNLAPALHAHIFPRYRTEPVDLQTKPVWFYDWEQAPAFDQMRDQPLMNRIAQELEMTGIVIA